MGIKSLSDLFHYFPRTYEDRSNVKNLDQVVLDGSLQVVQGTVTNKQMIHTYSGKKLTEIAFEDVNGKKWMMVFMNAQFKTQGINTGKSYLISGKPKFEKWKFIFWYPEVVESHTQEEELKMDRIYPIYSESLWIKSWWFAKKIRDNIWAIKTVIKEIYPEDFLKEFQIETLPQAVQNLHFPESFQDLKKAQKRIFFDKLLNIQLQSLLEKQSYGSNFRFEQTDNPDREVVKDIISKLPFDLTNAQKRAIKEVVDDLYMPKPMMRLLQGDVGSWKTIVATICAYYCIKRMWAQAAILAPTEVLAQQHLKSIAKLLLPLWINIELLTGSTPAKQKEKIKVDLARWYLHFVVGTHALIQEDVVFQNLKLAVIDEQHKFGVMQRAFFKRFNAPHLLQMTATPIPRSMALAFFWEFDVSIINEMPAWRKPIITKMVSEKEMIKLKQWLLTKLGQDQQLYVVTPLIEESEKMDELKSATQEFLIWQEFLSEYKDKIWLLHGKMKPKDKDEVMNDFKSGKLRILISTTVIEVWVDVPQATMMIIKNSERFGLSQLHQLRWRVWRNDLQSYCFLETASKSPESFKRLGAMEQYNDWFKLAEIDMQLRWTWEIMGVKQSWETDIPLDILSDLRFLEEIKTAAHWLLENHPQKAQQILTTLQGGTSNILL